jgi:Haloacid dehalogenase superfamily, subfamily IA, variant 2 with 3rd motif like haloacid dehalogenase
MRRFDLVAFDLYGTLLDISGLAARMRPVAGEGAAALLGRWRKAQLERTWWLNREGRYEPWDRVTAAALKEVAPELPTESRERLAELWLTVPAFPDAAATLATLGSVGVRRAVLSNGTRAMIARALEAGGLDVDRILSVDDGARAALRGSALERGTAADAIQGRHVSPLLEARGRRPRAGAPRALEERAAGPPRETLRSHPQSTRGAGATRARPLS